MSGVTAKDTDPAEVVGPAEYTGPAEVAGPAELTTPAEVAGPAQDANPAEDVRLLLELFDAAYWADPFPNEVLQMLDARIRHS